MPGYRCYLFDVDDQILDVGSSQQPDDEAATRWAGDLLRRDRAARAVELWDLARFLGRQERQQLG